MKQSLSISTKARCAALLLVVLTVLALFGGCKKEPDTVSVKNEQGGYSFCCPEDWNVSKNGEETVLTNAAVGGAAPYAIVRFTVADNSQKLSARAFWEQTKGDYDKAFLSAKVERSEDLEVARGTGIEVVINAEIVGETSLDGQPDKEGESSSYIIRQLVYADGDRLCTVTYMSTPSNYEDCGEIIADIKESFEFIDKADKQPETDKGLADFTLPLPDGWVLDTSEGYYVLSFGKATVTATVHSATESGTALYFWENVYKKSLETDFLDFELLELKEDIVLDGIKAVEADYKASTASGGRYRFTQRIAVFGGEVYSVLLTASDEDYSGAYEGYKQIVEGFNFK